MGSQEGEHFSRRGVEIAKVGAEKLDGSEADLAQGDTAHIDGVTFQLERQALKNCILGISVQNRRRSIQVTYKQGYEVKRTGLWFIANSKNQGKRLVVNLQFNSGSPIAGSPVAGSPVERSKT